MLLIALAEKLAPLLINTNPARWFVSWKYLPDYAKMIKLEVNTTNNRITASILLKGEPSTLDIIIDGYEVIHEDSAAFFRANDVSSSKEWVTAILENFLVEGRVSVPPDLVSLLSKTLGEPTQSEASTFGVSEECC